MKLLFKQRMFSWLCSYDVFNEQGEILYKVKGELSWGHKLQVYDAAGNHLGTVKQVIFSFLPAFEIYKDGVYQGRIRKEFAFFHPKFVIECNGWRVEGDWAEWDYEIHDRYGEVLAVITKKLFNWTDTYEISLTRPEYALDALMMVLAIDAEKCSRN